MPKSSWSQSERPRLIVLADMGNEPDEEQQILHLLMCANEVDLEGLIAVTGKHLGPHHAVPQRHRLYPDLFHRLIDGYEKVLPNLHLHADGFPAADQLRSIVASGQAAYGVADSGQGKSSPGSKLILAAATRSDARPLHIVVNAGANTLAQSLLDYRATHSKEEISILVKKLVVYDNQAQDDAGAWICHEFPDIHWVRSKLQARAYGGPSNKDYGPHVWKPFPYSISGQDEWAHEHVRTNHSALGALYPARSMNGSLHFIEGGGTIPWMRLISPGLTDPTEPTWGGWSGRYTAEKQSNPFSQYKDVAGQEKASTPFAMYVDAQPDSESWTNPETGERRTDACASVFRWRAAMWNDFQARMDWCNEPYSNANHHPHAVLNGDSTNAILIRTAKVGDELTFSSSGSSDPDNDPLSVKWWFYPEAGQNPYGRELPIDDANAPSINVTIPHDAVEKELHLILEVRDSNAIVPLVDYRRVVIKVQP